MNYFDEILIVLLVLTRNHLVYVRSKPLCKFNNIYYLFLSLNYTIQVKYLQEHYYYCSLVLVQFFLKISHHHNNYLYVQGM